MNELVINETNVVELFSTFSEELVILKKGIKDKKIITEEDKSEITLSLKSVGGLRRDIEKKRKETNEPALKFTKLVNNYTKKLDTEIRDIENLIKIKIQTYSEEQAKVLAEKLAADKITAHKVA